MKKLLRSTRRTQNRHGFGRFGIRVVLLFTVFFLLIYALNWASERFLTSESAKVLRSTCASNAEVAAYSINNIFEEAYQSSSLAELMPGFQMITSPQWDLEQLENYADVPPAIRALSNVTAINQYITGIAFYRRDLSLVITDSGMYQADAYFDNYHVYDSLPMSFWADYQPQNAFSVMSARSVSTPSANLRVLPVTKNHINDIYSRNLYIVDLNVSKIELLLGNYCPTENSMLLMADSSGEKLLCSSTLSESFDPQSVLDLIAGGTSSTAPLEIGGQKYYVYFFPSEFFFIRICTALCIPESDLTAMLNQDSYFRIQKVLIPLLALMLIALFSLIIYAPISELVQTIKPGDSKIPGSKFVPHDELQFIHNEFSRMGSDLQQAEREIEYVAPIARRQLLRRLLLNQSLSAEDLIHLDSFFPASGCFGFLLIKPIYRDELYHAYSPDFAVKLPTALKQISADLFSTQPNTHVIELRSNRLCILMHGDTDCHALLRKRAESLLSLFQADESSLSLFIVNSTPCSERCLLPQAYQEAEETLSQLPPEFPSCIYDASSRVTISSYELPLPLERKLVNLIVCGKKDELFALLKNDILPPEKLSCYPTPVLQKLFMQLYFITAQALRENGQTCNQRTYAEFAEFNLKIDEKTPLQIREFLLSFFDQIIAQYDGVPLTLSSGLFRDYIDAHYTEDLSLDLLAEKYNTSAQYIARLLKKELGMSFQSYLHTLRITKAKELLLNTSLSVQDIYIQIGYQSRNTFIRSFKALEGLTPSEYRHVWKKTTESEEEDS